MFILVRVGFVGSLLFMIFSSGKMSTSSALPRLHMKFFFPNKKFEEGAQRMVAQARVNVHETMGRKNNCKLNFFSMYFVRNNEEIYLSFKNSGHKLENVVLAVRSSCYLKVL